MFAEVTLKNIGMSDVGSVMNSDLHCDWKNWATITFYCNFGKCSSIFKIILLSKL